MTGEIAMAIYRPRLGQEEAFLEAVAEHVPILRRAELATARPVLFLKAPQDHIYIEIFEWRSAELAKAAEQNPAVAEIWQQLASLAEFLSLADLSNSRHPFPHFQPLDGVTI